MAASPILAAESIRHEREEVSALKSVLEDAIDQRGRYYHSIFNLSVTFEADNTSAARDTHNFQQMLKMLSLPKAVELVIESEDITPAWTVGEMLQKLARKVQESDMRSLIICYYAGHARVSTNGDLCFYASDLVPRAMTMNRTFGMLSDKEPFRNSDVILILESCFAGTAIRGMDSRDRSLEVIASVGYDQSALGNPFDYVHLQNRTFTSRLTDEVAKRIGREDVSTISFAKIVDELRKKSNPDRLPQYCLQVGRAEVRIPIPSTAKVPPHLRLEALSGSSPIHHRRLTSSESSAGYEASTPQAVIAIFKVHLENTNAASPEVVKLVQWIHSLNPNIGLILSGVYMSRSTELIFMAPRHLWAKLCLHRGFSLVCETFGSDRLPAILSDLSEQQQPPQSPRPQPPHSQSPRPQSPHPQPPHLQSPRPQSSRTQSPRPTGQENEPFQYRFPPSKPDRQS